MPERTTNPPRVLVAGETLVDLVASDGTFGTANAFHPRAGGAPANVAAGLCTLGEPAWLWTRIGDDEFGARCQSTLESRGVPKRFVEIDPDRQTAVAFAAGHGIEEGGGGADHEFAFYHGADRYMGQDDPATVPDADVLAGVDIVVVGGIALAAKPARTAVLELLDAAEDADCIVVFDPNARPEAWRADAFERVTKRVLERADIVKATPGDLEHAGLDVGESAPTPADGPAVAERVCEYGPHTTFLTLGSAGAAAASTASSPFGHGGATHFGYDVDVVDPTGAGDAFLAAVVAELARGVDDPYDILDVATAAGALTTTGRGGMTALPSLDEIGDLVERPE